MINLSVIFFGLDTVKIGDVRVKVQLCEWISKDWLNKIFFYIHGGRGLLLLKRNQVTSEKKLHCFCFGKFSLV